MAKPSWLIISPASGSGNGTISNSAAAHTGRVARTGTVTVTGAGVAEPATYAVTQEAKAEFASFDNGVEMAVAAAGGNITIAGKSNSSKLTFAWITPDGQTQPEYTPDGDEEYGGVDFPTIVLPAQYSAGGVQTNNGTAISGDPGADAEFAFSIVIEFPENTVAGEVDRTLQVMCNGSQVAQIVCKQTAATPTLSVSPQSITIPQAGTAVNVTVTSNTTWSAS